MYRQKIVFIFILIILAIAAERERKKTCIHNLVINRTNLLTFHRKQLLVLGVINFNNPGSREQANRYRNLFDDLKRRGIPESVVNIFLINEESAAQSFSGSHYDRLRVYQDNSKDHLNKKLRHPEHTMGNYVFGRCGFLIYSQNEPHSNLSDEKTYQELLRVIITAVKNKRRCQAICS